MNKTKNIKRCQWGNIDLSSLNEKTRKQIINLIGLVSNAKKIDEHGNWDFGKSFDYKGRGYALNWDLYGVGRDFHTKRMLIVVQVRQYIKQKATYFPTIRKSYFLIGRNEDNSVFAHPVESRVIMDAIKKSKDVVYTVQSWMFQHDYKNVLRQGDFAIIPIKKQNGLKLEEKEIILEQSHKLQADEIYKKADNLYYARNPILTHIPNTHKTINSDGWCKIFMSNRANYWDFASPTVD